MLGQDDFYPQVARLLSSYQCRPSGLPENLLEHKIWSINKLKTYLLTRGYNNNFLEEQFLRAANISRTNALQTNLKLLTMLYHLLSHITQHFHAFLISYANILTSYTPLTVAKTSAALGVSLVLTVMQMRCIVWEPSDWFRWGTMVRKSEVIGNGRKSSEKFGSRKSSEHKGRTFELLLYTSRTWIYMCKRRSQPRHVGLSPAQCAWAKQNACVEENMG